MSESHRRYNAINKALVQCYPGQMRGHVLRHFNTLALLICGIVGAGHTHLSEVASHSPEKTKVESRVKKFKRWLMNGKVSQEVYWQPFAKALVAGLTHKKNEVSLVIDGSVIGTGLCGAGSGHCLRWTSITFGLAGAGGSQRAILPRPTIWPSCSRIKPLIPPGTRVILVGDGEFDGTLLQAELQWSNWHYVVRTACKSRLRHVGQEWSEYGGV